MNLELMKKLEDLKATEKNLSIKIGEQIDIKKNQYIQIVKTDFANFFKEKGFQIDSQNLFVTATYGNLVARLSHEKPDKNYLGCYFLFDLNLKPLNGKEYSIILSKSEPHSGISVSFKNPNGPSDAELQEEIESVQASIIKSQDRLDNFSHEEWKLFIKNDSSMHNGVLSEGYSSTYELLSSLVK